MISCPKKENTHNPHPLRFMVFLCFLSALVADELWQGKTSNFLRNVFPCFTFVPYHTPGQAFDMFDVL